MQKDYSDSDFLNDSLRNLLRNGEDSQDISTNSKMNSFNSKFHQQKKSSDYFTIKQKLDKDYQKLERQRHQNSTHSNRINMNNMDKARKSKTRSPTLREKFEHKPSPRKNDNILILKPKSNKEIYDTKNIMNRISTNVMPSEEKSMISKLLNQDYTDLKGPMFKSVLSSKGYNRSKSVTQMSNRSSISSDMRPKSAKPAPEKVKGPNVEHFISHNFNTFTGNDLHYQNRDTNSFSNQEFILLSRFFKDEWRLLGSIADDEIEAEKKVNFDRKKIAEKELISLRDSIVKLKTQQQKIYKESEIVNKCIDQLVQNKDFSKFLLTIMQEKDSDSFNEQITIIYGHLSEIMKSSDIQDLKEQLIDLTEECADTEADLEEIFDHLKPENLRTFITLKEADLQIKKEIREEEQSSLLAPYLKSEAVELDTEMVNQILKAEILNKAVNKLDQETNKTKQIVDKFEGEKENLQIQIQDKEDELQSEIERARELNERMERLKKGRMKEITKEVEELDKEIDKMVLEVNLLEKAQDAARLHYEENKHDLDFQKNIIKEKSEDPMKDINNILNSTNKKEVVKALNVKIEEEKKIQFTQKQEIQKLEFEFERLHNKYNLIVNVKKNDQCVNTDHDMVQVDKIIDKFNKNFFQTDIQIQEEITKNYRFDSEDKDNFLKEMKIQFKVCCRKELQILSLDKVTSHKRLVCDIRNFQSIKEMKFQVFAKDMEEIVKTIPFFNFIQDLRQIDQLIDGLTREFFNIKESVNVSDLVTQFLEWVVIYEDCQFDVTDERKLLDSLKKKLENFAGDLQSTISINTRGKQGSTDLVDTLKLERDKWDEITEDWDFKLSQAQVEQIELREQHQCRHVRKFDMADVSKQFQWRFIFDDSAQHKMVWEDWEPVFLQFQRSNISKEMANELDLVYLQDDS